MSTLSTRLLSAIAAAVCISACGASEPTDFTSDLPLSVEQPSIEDLDGTWFISSYAVDGIEASPGRDTSAVVDLNVEIMALEGAAGCGTFYGSFTFGVPTDDTVAGFTIPGRTSSTCEPEVRATNDLVIAALEGTTHFSRSGESIQLTGPASSVTLIPAN